MIAARFRVNVQGSSILICLIVLAHVAMVHSGHASQPSERVEIHAEHRGASNTEAIAVAPADIVAMVAWDDDTSCPSPAWVAQRVSLLADAGLVANVSVSAEIAAIAPPASPTIGGELPWPDGPDRQAALQRFRL